MKTEVWVHRWETSMVIEEVELVASVKLMWVVFKENLLEGIGWTALVCSYHQFLCSNLHRILCTYPIPFHC